MNIASSRKPSRLAKLLLIIFGILIGALAALWFVCGRLAAAAPQAVGPIPADLKGRDVQFSSTSGATIHGWLFPGQPGRGAILLLHGVRSNRLSMTQRARFLYQAGYSVLLIDFQGHGESSGQHITFGYLEARDVRAAINFLRQELPEERIGLLGVSMGGAAAILSSPKLDVNAMVLEMVYPTIDDAIADRLAMTFGGWSRSLSPLLSWQLGLRLGVSRTDLRPIDRVPDVTTPKLFIAGSEDRHTPLDESQRLFAAAPEPKELWVVEKARHQDLYSFTPVDYEQHVLSFFASTVRQH